MLALLSMVNFALACAPRMQKREPTFTAGTNELVSRVLDEASGSPVASAAVVHLAFGDIPRAESSAEFASGRANDRECAREAFGLRAVTGPAGL